jgi:hypothetical protein
MGEFISRLGFFFRSPEDGSSSSFRNVVILMTFRRLKSKKELKPQIITVILTK